MEILTVKNFDQIFRKLEKRPGHLVLKQKTIIETALKVTVITPLFWWGVNAKPNEFPLGRK